MLEATVLFCRQSNLTKKKKHHPSPTDSRLTNFSVNWPQFLQIYAFINLLTAKASHVVF